MFNISVKRNPYLASLLSIIVPGMGFLYSANNKKFIVIFSLSLISTIFAIFSKDLYLFCIFMIINGLNFLYGIVYSFIETKRLETIDASALKGITSYLALILFSFIFNYFSFCMFIFSTGKRNIWERKLVKYLD